MSEQLANELLLSLGTTSASLKTATNLVDEFGSERVRGFLAEIAAGGQRGQEVKAGLLTSLVCYSDQLAEVLGKIGIQTQRRTILRAVKNTPGLDLALKRLLAGEESDDDADLVKGAIMQAVAGKSGAQLTSAAGTPSASTTPAAPIVVELAPPKPAPLPAASQPHRPAPRPAPVSNAANDARASESRVSRDDLHIYGAKAALALEPTTSRSGALALTVDAAVGTLGKYDWRNKIIVQLAKDEMYLLYAVLRGFLVRFEANAHGQSNDKSFSIENQGSKFFVKVVQKGRSIVAIPVELPDALALASMLVKSIVAAEPHLGGVAGVDALINPMTAMMLSQQRKAG